MWTIYRPAPLITMTGVVAWLLCSGAQASDRGSFVNQNQTGITLPGVVSPNGFDEVRASDGTSCRSAMSGSGAYMDSGVIGGGLNGNTSTLSAYGRLVVPLGERPRRLDCDRLYQLELRRLQLEVDLLERGLNQRPAAGLPADSAMSGGWAQGPGWSAGERK
ncbi:hypothetical protein [Nitratireductor soli]|uniref:hypothetical protein n=1 Tax=Nitratireductor soli TaxID=1670619 RepID=UPI00069ED331|nr:hypothetical protein [Nitratireductor soli]